VTYLIVVRRDRFELDLYKRWPLGRWKRVRRYPIAVGMVGLETPPGLFEVLHKDRTPDYTYPDSDWVRELGVTPATVIPWDDPNNPVAPRWIGISDDEGIGIHGTSHPETLGTQASHGCIRLAPGNVIELYRLVKRGTPCFIY
jgi:lipoprotein-anchoring transpeptidase ErfK/SrfK